MTVSRIATENDRLAIFKLAAQMHLETDFRFYDFDPSVAIAGLSDWLGGDPNSAMFVAEAVKATPVSSWRYKDGQGDGGAHVGPMAQNVRKTMGETAAPGGKQIDLISMNGISMAAIGLRRWTRRWGGWRGGRGKTDLHR